MSFVPLGTHFLNCYAYLEYGQNLSCSFENPNIKSNWNKQNPEQLTKNASKWNTTFEECICLLSDFQNYSSEQLQKQAFFSLQSMQDLCSALQSIQTKFKIICTFTLAEHGCQKH